MNEKLEREYFDGATEEDVEEARQEGYDKMLAYMVDFVLLLGPEEYEKYRLSFMNGMEKEGITDYHYNVCNLALQALQIGHFHMMKEIKEKEEEEANNE